ncbi:MAG: hypothetical protein KHX14_08120 [[Clostridium] spiroforme]|uniref:Gram-positive cocci surface proteins LPxTG domain-containing protein n=1 Tax=Thomasclavelia spiroformis TaxID=29348 RepID=A0A943I3Q8_9FIRM|nr:prealbumin-like fold domain-containing protein [Thomasclavelia spiroformis]MBS5588758.1 hypothetical protein [Thomasclavelia spiroformis]
MRRIKKLFILQLAVILVFSVITVMSSADANIPQGPIDSTDKDNGVNQIMEAGIEDKNFATAIYDSFVSVNYFGDETKDVRQILGEYEGVIDAANRGIKSIYGIEWLRNTTLIDLSNRLTAPNETIKNEIKDLLPLSIEYIMQIADVTESEATKWYREEHNNNLEIDLSGNPIANYKECGGKLLIRINEDNVASFEGYYLNAIKTGAVDWSVDLKVDTPEIYKDDHRVQFSKDPLITQILGNVTTVNDDIMINYNAFDNNVLEIDNIKHSGRVVAILGIPTYNGISFFKYLNYGGGGAINRDIVSYSYGTNFMSRIYMPVVAKKTFKTNVKVTKSATSDNSGKKVVGAKYYLYYDDGDQNFENDALVFDRIYITDENGEFYVNENLGAGEYYLKEFEAPEGFLINEEPIFFNITADKTTVNVTGGDKDLKINAGDIKEDPNTVYIDRYSKDIEVNIEIDPAYAQDPNYKIESVDITYFDRNKQEFITFNVTGPDTYSLFASPDEATKWITDWINSNKGNEENPGIIDGQVTINAHFTHYKELQTSDPRPKIDVEFDKARRDFDENGDLNLTPLPGATFKLECMHKHTEKCKDKNGGYTNCTDPHTDDFKYLTDEGCSWTSEAISDSEGKVKFTGLNTGKYKMKETIVPDGYLPTETTWILTVDAIKNTFGIVVDSTDDNSDLIGNNDDGYTIVNETYNIKVIKIDAETKEKLVGAEFGLFKKEANGKWSSDPVQTSVTNDNGLAFFEKLSVGEYKIKELTAPPGYEIITDEVMFKLPFEYLSKDLSGVENMFSSDSKTITFTISNKVGFNLPKTGAVITARIAAIGIVIMGITIIFLKKTRKIEKG